MARLLALCSLPRTGRCNSFQEWPPSATLASCRWSRAAYVEWTVRECQDATQLGLVQIRRRFIDTANTLLDAADLPSIRTASRIIAAHFPTVAKVAVSDERIEYLSDIPDSELEKMRLIRDAARGEKTNRQSVGGPRLTAAHRKHLGRSSRPVWKATA